MTTTNIHCGDSAEVLKQYPDCHFDSVVTDPPYGIEFLGKDWDRHTGTVELWREVFRVLKPGGYLLAFSAARTYHHLATNIEGVGFEIKDQLMWLYSSGFPKAQDVGKMIDKAAGKVDVDFQPTTLGHIPFNNDLSSVTENRCSKCNKGKAHYLVCEEEVCARKYKIQTDVGKQWAGWKTALKPAHEPIVMARKPTKLSFAANVQKYGTGALNIDATRIDYEGPPVKSTTIGTKATFNNFSAENLNKDKHMDQQWEGHDAGRYPSNVIGEIEGYQKYFYCPKVSRKERHLGFDDYPSLNEMVYAMGGHFVDDNGNECLLGNGTKSYKHPTKGVILIHGIKSDYQEWQEKNKTNFNVGNNHPTVKPIELMAYLVRLVTPKGGTVLDPFNGSGSTGLGCVKEGMNYVGCDLDQRYVDISNTRIAAYRKEIEKDQLPADLFGDEKDKSQS
jgi:DNA modification methylase